MDEELTTQVHSLRLCGKKVTQFAELNEHEIFMNRRATEVFNLV